MTINEILNSGLLELYTLGQTTEEENSIIENGLKQSSELKAELFSIQECLLNYAQIYSVNPAPGLKSKILSRIKSETNTNPATNKKHQDLSSKENSKNSIFSWLLLLSCLGLIGAYFLSNKSHNALQKKYNNKVVLCDSIAQAQNIKIAILENIQNKSNRIIELKATDKYPGTEAYFHYNTELKKNYIQIKNLPNLASNQSFQLWALKGDNAPVPLDVFEVDKDNIFEVEFFNAPDAYAITIEPRGGKDSPTLENLIGVISIAG